MRAFHQITRELGQTNPSAPIRMMPIDQRTGENTLNLFRALSRFALATLLLIIMVGLG